jgi:hypothetical protein
MLFSSIENMVEDLALTDHAVLLLYTVHHNLRCFPAKLPEVGGDQQRSVRHTQPCCFARYSLRTRYVSNPVRSVVTLIQNMLNKICSLTL